jgi:hypothetical protein
MILRYCERSVMTNSTNLLAKALHALGISGIISSRA